MFKIGDTVYCINNHYTINKPLSSLITFLHMDTPYVIEDFYNVGNNVKLKGIRQEYSFVIDRFISEPEYLTSKRKEKILYLKKLINYKKREKIKRKTR